MAVKVTVPDRSTPHRLPPPRNLQYEYQNPWIEELQSLRATPSYLPVHPSQSPPEDPDRPAECTSDFESDEELDCESACASMARKDAPLVNKVANDFNNFVHRSAKFVQNANTYIPGSSIPGTSNYIPQAIQGPECTKARETAGEYVARSRSALGYLSGQAVEAVSSFAGKQNADASQIPPIRAATVARLQVDTASSQHVNEFAWAMGFKCRSALVKQGICRDFRATLMAENQLWQEGLRRDLIDAYPLLASRIRHQQLVDAQPNWTWCYSVNAYQLILEPRKLATGKAQLDGRQTKDRIETGVWLTLQKGWAGYVGADVDCIESECEDENCWVVISEKRR